MACCRAFGVAILALSLGAGATRHEHPAAFLGVRGAQELRVGMVPSAISRAIQHALRDSRAHLKALTTAEKDVTRLDPASILLCPMPILWLSLGLRLFRGSP